jgi:hypothetical protein
LRVWWIGRDNALRSPDAAEALVVETHMTKSRLCRPIRRTTSDETVVGNFVLLRKACRRPWNRKPDFSFSLRKVPQDWVLRRDRVRLFQCRRRSLVHTVVVQYRSAPVISWRHRADQQQGVNCVPHHSLCISWRCGPLLTRQETYFGPTDQQCPWDPKMLLDGRN